MIEIVENQTLEVENLLSFRGNVTQAEMTVIGKEMEELVNRAGIKRKGSPITATYGMVGDKIDVEILLPIDKETDSTEKYLYKKKIKIVNAVVAKYLGNPNGLQEACDELNHYIIEHKLIPITVGYNVTKKVNPMNLEETEIEVYVGISPNIL